MDYSPVSQEPTGSANIERALKHTVIVEWYTNDGQKVVWRN